MRTMVMVGLAAAAAAVVAVLALSLVRRGSSSAAQGDLAPEFALPGSDGRTHRLAEFRGRKAVVVAWFPKAFTGG